MQFNTICATPRVMVEHCIGTLKGRFPFLRNIRIKITEEPESIRKIQRYIRVAVILHNLMVGFNEEQFEYEEDNIDNNNNAQNNNETAFSFTNPNTDGIGEN